MSEEDISAKASRLAASMAYFLNLTSLLASPRIAAKVNQMSTREHLLEHVDGFIELLSVDDESSVRTGGKAVDLRSLEPYALKLRELLSAWTPSPDIPVEIRETARALLHAFGIPDPPEGWDQFEGWPEDEAGKPKQTGKE